MSYYAAKVRHRFRRRSSHAPNQMHKLILHYHIIIMQLSCINIGKYIPECNLVNERNMAKSKATLDPCSVCFSRYKVCLYSVSLPICNCCSMAETNESSAGWIVGTKVGYCSNSVKEKNEFENNDSDQAIFNDRPNKKYKWYVLHFITYQ